MDALRIHTPGSYTAVQDLGRFDFYHLGVPVSGSLDDYAHRAANWLVGNPPGAAVLEMSLIGPSLEFLGPADIAVTGAQMTPLLNGHPCPLWASIRVNPGDHMALGVAENGCRAYLAISGGIDVPVVMGSRSTFVGGRLGGWQGRLLTAGDVLPRRDAPLLQRPRRLPWRPVYPEAITLRAVPGPHEDLFQTHLEVLFSSSFQVSAHANRMGCRLKGPQLQRDPGAPESIVSVPVIPGNIQTPPDGQPIILLREQTIGGYTIIATVISPDLFRIAQAKPQDTVRFVRVNLAEAHHIVEAWDRFLKETEEAIIHSATEQADE